MKQGSSLEKRIVAAAIDAGTGNTNIDVGQGYSAHTILKRALVLFNKKLQSTYTQNTSQNASRIVSHHGYSIGNIRNLSIGSR